MAPTAFSYIRFSSRQQASGDSLRRQTEATETWCRQHGIRLSDKNFHDLGISAFKDKNRASLDDMLTAIQNGSIKPGDYIILENLDRLSRQGIDHTQEVLRSILRQDVNIISLSDGLELNKSSLDDLIAVIRIAVAADLAHKESEKKAKRVFEAKQRQKEDAISGRVRKGKLPFWIGYNEDENGYVLNENAVHVREMVKLRQEGYGFHKIAMHLNGNKITTANGGKWSDTAIRLILKSPPLYGTMVYGKWDGNKSIEQGRIDNHYPSLISYQEFQSIQPKAAANAGGVNVDNPLARLVKCGSCGAAMAMKTHRKSKNQLRYWVCTKSVSGACTSKKQLRSIDHAVYEACGHFKTSKPATVDGTVDSINKRIDQLNAKKAELESALMDGLSVGSIIKAIADVDDKIKGLNTEKRTHIQTSSEDIDCLSDLMGDPVKFNIAIRRVVDKVTVFSLNRDKIRVKVSQLNGHTVNVIMTRKNLRHDFKCSYTSDTEKFADKVDRLMDNSNYPTDIDD